jgi:hypothetical protein
MPNSTETYTLSAGKQFLAPPVASAFSPATPFTQPMTPRTPGTPMTAEAAGIIPQLQYNSVIIPLSVIDLSDTRTKTGSTMQYSLL